MIVYEYVINESSYFNILLSKSDTRIYADAENAKIESFDKDGVIKIAVGITTEWYTILAEQIGSWRNGLAGMVSAMGDVSDRGKIIPVEQKSNIEMHLAGGNNPCGAKEQARDASGRWK